jgi:hypothetical protein
MILGEVRGRYAATQFPSVPSPIPSSRATAAIGRDVSITNFTASSRNSGEKFLFARDNCLPLQANQFYFGPPVRKTRGGSPSPPGVCTVTALTVRVSRRPCPVSRRRSPTGTCTQGGFSSWSCRVGWFALTWTIRCPPRTWTSRAWALSARANLDLLRNASCSPDSQHGMWARANFSRR